MIDYNLIYVGNALGVAIGTLLCPIRCIRRHRVVVAFLLMNFFVVSTAFVCELKTSPFQSVDFHLSAAVINGVRRAVGGFIYAFFIHAPATFGVTAALWVVIFATEHIVVLGNADRTSGGAGRNVPNILYMIGSSAIYFATWLMTYLLLLRFYKS